MFHDLLKDNQADILEKININLIRDHLVIKKKLNYELTPMKFCDSVFMRLQECTNPYVDP
jgi:hypothetical protein